jgi:nitrate/nitrite transporter NarK
MNLRFETLATSGIACISYLSTTHHGDADRIGRCPTLLISIIGMLCAFVIVMGLSDSYATTGESSTGLAVIPFLFIYFGSTSFH